MYILDISLNIMTLMVTSLTIGIGVDYGIHISHRFSEDIEVFDNISDAIHNTVTHTGLALFGGATTTIAGFGLIAFASMPPIAQFGRITALTILYSSIASVFVLPTFLILWAKSKKRKDEGVKMDEGGDEEEKERPKITSEES
jgi:predicted RND superfamily exporter protein